MFPQFLLAAAFAAATPICMDETNTIRLYDDWCCCTHGWCAPLQDNQVREVTNGYVFVIPPNGHPKLNPGTYFAPRRGSNLSRDGRWHVCGSGTYWTCFYFAPGGV